MIKWPLIVVNFGHLRLLNFGLKSKFWYFNQFILYQKGQKYQNLNKTYTNLSQKVLNK